MPRSVSTIPFDLARLNEGDAFHLNSGIFTVPVPGIYHFQFSAVKDESAPYLNILLKVNETTLGATWTEQTATGIKNVASFSASLRLKAGDKVSTINGGSGAIFDDDKHYTHFSGWLVEQHYDGDEHQSSYQQHEQKQNRDELQSSYHQFEQQQSIDELQSSSEQFESSYQQREQRQRPKEQQTLGGFGGLVQQGLNIFNGLRL